MGGWKGVGREREIFSDHYHYHIFLLNHFHCLLAYKFPFMSLLLGLHVSMCVYVRLCLVNCDFVFLQTVYVTILPTNSREEKKASLVWLKSMRAWTAILLSSFFRACVCVCVFEGVVGQRENYYSYTRHTAHSGQHFINSIFIMPLLWIYEWRVSIGQVGPNEKKNFLFHPKIFCVIR